MTRVLQWVLPVDLGVLMLGVGLGIELRELTSAIKRLRTVIAVVLSMQVIIPAICAAAAYYAGLPPATAAGVVLLASCPGGIFSNYMTRLGAGNVSLSVALTVIVTLVYALVAPFWASLAMHWLTPGPAASMGQYSAMQVVMPLLAFVALPATAGILLRNRWQRLAEHLAPWLRETGALVLIAIYVSILYDTRATLAEGMRHALLPVLAFNAVGLAMSSALAWALKLSRRDAVAVQVEHAIRQEGTGVYIATGIIGSSLASYPMLLNSLTGLLLACVIAGAARVTARRSKTTRATRP